MYQSDEKRSINKVICSRRQALKAVAYSLAAPTMLQFTSSQAQQDKSTVGEYISLDGNRVYVEQRGQGIPIVIGAGGQNRLETLRPLAEKLANKYHVITWDRANLGRADVVIEGARDLDVWSDQQALLIQYLGIRPAYFMGASSGGRTAYTTALRYPDHCRGLLTFLTTGGGTIGERLAQRYYYSHAEAAEEGGMEAVIEIPYWAERIELNSANKQRLLTMNPNQFAMTMRRWGSAMRSSDTMLGINADGCRQIKANGTPVAIVQGCEGETAHRKDRSEVYAELTGATLIPSTPAYCTEATTGPKYNELITRPEVPESPAFRAYEMITMLPEIIDTFIQDTEKEYKDLGLDENAFSLNIEQPEEEST